MVLLLTHPTQVLHLLIRLFTSLPSPDYFAITQCFVYLNDPSLASALISSLLSLPADAAATYIAPEHEKLLTAYQISFDLAETATQEFLEVVRTSLKGGDGSEALEGVAPAAPGAVVVAKVGSELHRERVVAILSGEESIRLHLEFLYRNNHADLLILKGTKVSLGVLLTVLSC